MRKNKDFLSTLLVLVFLLTLVFPISSSQVLRDTRTLNPTADSYVSRMAPDLNDGMGWWLGVRRSTDSEVLSFLMFDLSTIPSDAVVERAVLRLYADDVWGRLNYCIVGVHYCPNNDWSEMGITYNNKPAFSPDPITTVNLTSAYTWYTWNLFSTVQSVINSADKRLTLVLKTDTDGSASFNSKTNPFGKPNDEIPQLVVLYDAPSPSGINPVLTSLIIITVIVAAVISLELTYILRRRRRHVQPPPTGGSMAIWSPSFSFVFNPFTVDALVPFIKNSRCPRTFPKSS